MGVPAVRMKSLKFVAGALVAAALVVAPLVTAGAIASPHNGPDAAPSDSWSEDTNHVEYWEEKYAAHEADCYKVDGASSSGHGTVSADKKSIRLNEFDVAGWPGDHWEVLVIKAGSVGQTVVEHPIAGIAYASPINNGGQQATISHWIVCKGEYPSSEEPERPEAPAPTVTITATTEFNCDTDVATVTTTTTSSGWRYDAVAEEWVALEPVVSPPTTTTRPLTDSEKLDCPPDTKVESTPWVDATWACGDTTVTQVRRVLITTYTRDGTGAINPSTISKRETQTRALTQAELGTCPLVPGEIQSVCVGDVPYLGYAVSLPEGLVVDSSTPVTITFVNPDGEDYVVANQPLSGKLLWPGASDGNPKMWPGWDLVDGEYVQTDGNFAWTRAGVTVEFEVNPTYATEVEYPQATVLCAHPPVGSGDELAGTPTSTDAEALAVTGGGVSPIIVAAGGTALLAGVAVVAIAAYRRRHARAE